MNISSILHGVFARKLRLYEFSLNCDSSIAVKMVVQTAEHVPKPKHI